MEHVHATRAVTEGHGDWAAHVIEGEQRAAAFLVRIHDGQAHPDELAAIVAYLREELLHGFCRLVQRALEGRRG